MAARTRSPFLRSSDHMRSEHAFSTNTAVGTEDEAEDEEEDDEDETASGSVADGRRAATSAGKASCAGASASARATACDHTEVRSPSADDEGRERGEKGNMR